MVISSTTQSILTMTMIRSLIGLTSMMTTMVFGTISKSTPTMTSMMTQAKTMATSSQAPTASITMTMETMQMLMTMVSIKQYGIEDK